MADSAGMLAGAGVAGVDGLPLAAVVSLYRSRIPAAPLPSGRNRKTTSAGVAEHPAADAAAANRDALPVRGIPAGANHRTEGAPYLFWAVQLLVLGVLCLLGWVYVCLGLWCVPFVCFARPELPPWKVPAAAMQIMHGGRRELLALLGWYALQMLPLVTIPWVLPKAVLSVTVFCNLRCRLWCDAIANGTYRSLPRYVPSDK